MLQTILARPALFSAQVLGTPLRGYQQAPLAAVVRSVLTRAGREFVWIFPRQAGKNETVAHLEAYLLNLFQRAGGTIIHTAPVADQLTTGRQRLEARLDNAWNRGRWKGRRRPPSTTLGAARVLFLSGHPQANVRGATADHLIVFDETQDFSAHVGETVFAPMCASTNATRLYIGTPKTRHSYLAQKQTALAALEAADGIQRVFHCDWTTVAAELPAYRTFVANEIARKGARHPSIISEYWCEPLDAAGGLFDARRQALLRGDHRRQHAPRPDATYVGLLDVAGVDEHDPSDLARPRRDSSVAWIAEVDPASEATLGLPTYRLVDVLADVGSRHFGEGEEEIGRLGDFEMGARATQSPNPAISQSPPPSPLSTRLLAFFEHWQVAHVVADASGVGHGLVNWLSGRLGAGRVTAVSFAPATKSRLGHALLGVVETGRLRMYADDDADARRFWAQVAACTWRVAANRPLELGMKWGVPDAATFEEVDRLGNATRRPLHDDYLLAASLAALLDGRAALHGGAPSAVIAPPDDFWARG